MTGLVVVLLGSMVACIGETDPTTISFQEGSSGYVGTIETELWEVSPADRLDTNDRVTVDGNNSGGESQVLMRFDHIIGTSAGQIPPGSRIRTATLTLTAFDPGSTVSLYQMLIPWNASCTWNAMVGGVAADGFESASARDDFTFGNLVDARQSFDFDVTNALQAWADGRANYGWVFMNAGGNGWDFYTSESEDVAMRPKLVVSYDPPGVVEQR